MKLIIHGFGKMGKMVLCSVENFKDINVVAMVDALEVENSKVIPIYKTLDEVREECDVIIDFSHPSLLPSILKFALTKNIKLVLATTGYSEKDLKTIETASSQIPIFQSYNMSIGISILEEILDLITPKLVDSFDIEIVDKHHNKKLDAPSGTANLLYEHISKYMDNSNAIFNRSEVSKYRSKDEVGIHSIRGGTIFGEHSVIFAGEDEVIEIKHESLSKRVFALGSLRAACLIMKKTHGLYNLKTLYSK